MKKINSYPNTGFMSAAEAIYYDAPTPIDEDNIYIRALPPLIDDSVEVYRYYNKELIKYDGESERKLDASTRKKYVNQLKAYRVPLPYQSTLNEVFYNSLCDSYRLRKEIIIHENNNDTSILAGCVGDTSSSGFALIGLSGSGKSSSVKLLLDQYPQVIWHTSKQERRPQIVYIVVQCMPNSNLNAMYYSICESIDKLLGTSCYKNIISRRKSLGEKTNYIVSLFEAFRVGTLIVDEIQNLDFSQNKESSFESLLTITNKSKVPISVIGTEDAYNKMFKNLRNARRVGTIIQASAYCFDRKYINLILRSLSKYYWTKERMDVNEKTIDTFLNETQGIICLIINLYILSQQSAIFNNVSKVDSNLIKNVSNTYFSKLKPLLNDIQDTNKQQEIEKLIQESNKELEKQIDDNKQSTFINDILNNQENIDLTYILNVVTENIKTVTSNYNDEHIQSTIKKVIGKAPIDSLDIKDITQKTFIKLSKTKNDVRKNKPVSTNDMLNSLLND